MALNIPFRNAYYRFASSYYFSFLFPGRCGGRYTLFGWKTSRVDRDGIRYTLFGQPVYHILFMMFYGIVQDKLGLKKPPSGVWVSSWSWPDRLWFTFMTITAKQFFCRSNSGGALFWPGYLAGCGLLDSFTEKMARNFISNMEQRAPGDLLAMLLARLCRHIF